MNRKQQQHIKLKARVQLRTEAKYRSFIREALNNQVLQFLITADQFGFRAALQLVDSVVTQGPIETVLRELYYVEGPKAAKREERYFQAMYGKEFDTMRRSGSVKAFTFFKDWAKVFQDFFNTIGFTEVRNITETTRKWLRDQANALLDQDLTFQEIRDALWNSAKKINRKRANVIARTETLTALNNGSHQAAKALPVRMSHTWIATEDDRTRHTHRRLDGETVPLNAPFSNGGMYPGDPTLKASERIQCRCVEIHTPVRDRNGMLLAA